MKIFDKIRILSKSQSMVVVRPIKHNGLELSRKFCGDFVTREYYGLTKREALDRFQNELLCMLNLSDKLSYETKTRICQEYVDL